MPGIKFSALNPVLRPCLFDPQRGDSQIAIILQGEFNQRLQARVVEKFAPIDVGGSAAGGVGVGS